MLAILRKDSIYYISSILLHLFLLLLAGVYFEFLVTSKPIGVAREQIVSSYTVRAVAPQLPAPTQKAAVHMTRTKSVATPRQVASHARSSGGEKTSELLTLLHIAIQKQQHYPDSAMEMERQGRVTVKFMLLSNGTIQDLQLQHSSGTDSLDNAALAAVSAAAPFTHVEKYLDTAQVFSLDVVFQLS